MAPQGNDSDVFINFDHHLKKCIVFGPAAGCSSVADSAGSHEAYASLWTCAFTSNGFHYMTIL